MGSSGFHVEWSVRRIGLSTEICTVHETRMPLLPMRFCCVQLFFLFKVFILNSNLHFLFYIPKSQISFSVDFQLLQKYAKVCCWGCWFETIIFQFSMFQLPEDFLVEVKFQSFVFLISPAVFQIYNSIQVWKSDLFRLIFLFLFSVKFKQFLKFVNLGFRVSPRWTILFNFNETGLWKCFSPIAHDV